mmetsp:Transcript_9786/g.22151  ORF Transcript_9786/g.22151 Transcript_9786/m.22151 type:complete len:172 (+) Transcript_9786:145-660(+)
MATTTLKEWVCVALLILAVLAILTVLTLAVLFLVSLAVLIVFNVMNIDEPTVGIIFTTVTFIIAGVVLVSCSCNNPSVVSCTTEVLCKYVNQAPRRVGLFKFPFLSTTTRTPCPRRLIDSTRVLDHRGLRSIITGRIAAMAGDIRGDTFHSFGSRYRQGLLKRVGTTYLLL